MVFNLNKLNTTQVEPMIARIMDLQRDNMSNIMIRMKQLDEETGDVIEGTDRFFSINTFGLGNGTNYSVGEAFGAFTEVYQNEVGCYDLEKLIGFDVVCFIHKKKSRDGNQTYHNLVDVFPLEVLQFPWMVEEEADA
ncbi:hypothetical protein KQI58_20405 [Enterococcus raffinosus]|uniref:hypothetical protein n=1 Tax=Enterococcus raffinosus TaxID=71452 RepID=UPI001C11BE5C|nr:hypothetical protein [Enterococcus raffinosus]MBU5363388.1 hypothetical protein [Enterococcus raffinosus]